ncbi:MAG: dienelactone hydrolase family protein [Caulobacteraceae bacterium]
MIKRLVWAGLGALLFSGQALAQPAPPAAAAAAEMRQAFDAYYKMPDTRGTGPFAAMKEADPAFPGHVVYRPADLQKLGGRKLPILMWGNGGCSDDGGAERLFLEDIASYGYLVLAPGAILSGPGVPPRPPAPWSPGLSVKTTTAQVHQGLDQALAANTASGRWHDRLDSGRVAVGGYSCGGLQALAIASDPRVKAVVITHSGIFNEGGNPISGMQIDKSALRALHTPVLYLLGGKSDIAYLNGTDDYAKIDKVPVFLASHDVGHGGTFMKPEGGEEAQIVRAWLDWQLFGDKAAAKTFVGTDCGLCRMPEWNVTRKGF